MVPENLAFLIGIPNIPFCSANYGCRCKVRISYPWERCRVCVRLSDLFDTCPSTLLVHLDPELWNIGSGVLCLCQGSSVLTPGPLHLHLGAMSVLCVACTCVTVPSYLYPRNQISPSPSFTQKCLHTSIHVNESSSSARLHG